MQLKRIRIGDPALPDASSILREVLRPSFSPLASLERALHAFSPTSDAQDDIDEVVALAWSWYRSIPSPALRGILSPAQIVKKIGQKYCSAGFHAQAFHV